jgi:hypothetical protein
LAFLFSLRAKRVPRRRSAVWWSVSRDRRGTPLFDLAQIGWRIEVERRARHHRNGGIHAESFGFSPV